MKVKMKNKKLACFLRKYKNKFIYVLLFIFISLAFFSVNGAFWRGLKYEGDALTSDEVSHIPAGFYYLKTGRYFINPEHPFLIKDIAGLPLLFIGTKMPELPKDEVDNPQWSWGRSVLHHPQNNLDQIALFARLAVILFNASLLFLVYIYLKKFFGVKIALLASFFLIFSPTQIANSSLVVNDTTASFTLILAVFSFSDFIKNINKPFCLKLIKKIFVSAFFIFLTLSAKFSCVLILPALLLLGMIYTILSVKNKSQKIKFSFSFNFKKIFQFFGYFVLISLISFLLLGFSYGLHCRNMEKTGIARQLELNYPNNWPYVLQNLLVHSMDVPIIANFNKGIVEYSIGFFMVKSRVESAFQNLYFMGNVYGSEGAGIKYFPLIYLFKMTPGFLFLLCLSFVLCSLGCVEKIKKLRKNFWKGLSVLLSNKMLFYQKNPVYLGLGVLFFIYLAVSLTSSFQIGIRHIMPLIFILYIITAYWLVHRGKVYSFCCSKKVIVGACGLIIISNLLTFPHYLSYFNFLGGGTDNGYKIATDSNYDWAGQDLKRLAKWVRDNKIKKIYLHMFTNLEPKSYLGDAYESFNLKGQDLPPSGSLIAVSAFEMQDTNYRQGLNENHRYFQLANYQIDHIGKTIFIFRVP